MRIFSGTGTCWAGRARTSTRVRSRASGVAPGTRSSSSRRSRIRSCTTSAARRRAAGDRRLLPVFVLDRYEGLEARLVQDLTPEERERYVELNASALRERLPADVVFANHVVLGGPVAAATGARFRVKAHGSELEYSMRGNEELSIWGREALARAEAVFVGSRAHPRGARGRRRPRRPRRRGASRRRRGRSSGRCRAPRRSRVARRGAARSAESRQRERAAARRGQRRAARGVLRERRADGRLLREAASTTRASTSCSRRSRPRAKAVDRRLRRLPRELEALAPRGTLFTGALEHRHLAACSRCATWRSCRRSSPRRSAWSRPRPRRPGVHRSSRATPVSPRSPTASRPSTRRAAPLTSFSNGDVAELRDKLAALLALPADDRARSATRPRAAVDALELGERGGAPAGASNVGAPWATRRSSPDEQVRSAFEAYEGGTDFTVAVEEEFAILDRETLELTNRFEELQAAAQGTPLEEHLVGELIASEVEVRTGRCETFAEAAAKMVERRAQLARARAVGRRRARVHRDASVEPLAGPAHHRHAALPAERRDPPLRRVAQQHVRAARPRRHPRRRPRGRRLQLAAQLPAGAARAVGELAVRRGRRQRLHSARTEIFTRMFPRCGVPDAYDGWAGFEEYVRFLYDTGSIDEHTQIWWSVRPHLAYPDGRDPHLRRRARPRRGAVARGAHLHARRAARARLDEGEPRRAAAEPPDRGEPLARDPLRPLRRADRPRPETYGRRARTSSD